MGEGSRVRTSRGMLTRRNKIQLRALSQSEAGSSSGGTLEMRPCYPSTAARKNTLLPLALHQYLDHYLACVDHHMTPFASLRQALSFGWLFLLPIFASGQTKGIWHDNKDEPI